MTCDVCQAPTRELNAVSLPGRWRALLVCDVCHKAHKAGQLLLALQRAEARQQLPPHLQRGRS